VLHERIGEFSPPSDGREEIGNFLRRAFPLGLASFEGITSQLEMEVGNAALGTYARTLDAVSREHWDPAGRSKVGVKATLPVAVENAIALLSSQSRDQLSSGLPAAQFAVHLAVALANEALLQFGDRTAFGCDLEGSIDDASFIHG
jgi:hypothetical protein